ncbi:growth inhibitor PemK [Gallibacterium salpingitidis]|uniref:Growth inhibitor PemK n=1 Tax=Gallibacterium salpingitidis TaxID=505341 RepID=A0AB36E580_9PAST|nr:type II toxin-antitoxin system PemK/MazF family toxin [Gallibacterium salpingitidis]OBX08826.1 growth inhibitor PemK [Gallibacterium salpingitidis]OBX10267.1 growth inhibitor PemK [Gallibacterium salpingitidis]WKT00919.1 type II toxin-antitoxin system PemK/MazF family toxin [Gallibacterium salpingitidis]
MVMRIPKKGEIWYVDPDPTAGKELRNPHYFIVISEQALNKALGVAMCCPISIGGNAARSQSVTVVLDGASIASGKVTGVVLCHQIRSLDLVAREAKFATTAEPYLVDEVVMKLVDLIDPQI